MIGINQVFLVGTAGTDPEQNTTRSGAEVASFKLATNSRWVDRATGEPREATEWHRIVAFRHAAGIINKYVTKGAHVVVQGSLKTRAWVDDAQVNHSVTDIVVDQIRVLGGKRPMEDKPQPKVNTHASIHADIEGLPF
jgi:single-strand DNA-binding protein